MGEVHLENYLYLFEQIEGYKDFLDELEKECFRRFGSKIVLHEKKLIVTDAIDQEATKNTLAFFRKILLELDHLRFPKWWINIIKTIEDGFFMTELTNGKIYDHVKSEFSKNCDKEILKIEIVQNSELWSVYKLGVTQTLQRHKIDNQKLLWHGTSGAEPLLVYKGEEGFDMKFSHEGMWGRGLYFAAKSKYSDPYSHTTTQSISVGSLGKT